MATDFDDAAKTLRAWAKAYRDGPTEHRFPPDPHAEFFPGDMDAGAAEIARLNDECQASMETIARERERAEKAEAEIEGLKVERLKLDRRIHNQRVALRENWQIVEMRANYKRLPQEVRSRMLRAWSMAYREARELRDKLESLTHGQETKKAGLP